MGRRVGAQSDSETEAASDKGRPVSYARAHLVAINLFANLRGCQDVRSCFVVKKALAGWARLEGTVKDKRRRLDALILGSMLASLHKVYPSAFEGTLFGAAFSIAFYGALGLAS
ncbi:hypothetical protein NDU88_004209 [Pleurodeles waltl]|uniref:Uncharacterized protein n=1 Tax=Pleurodeles waltl TaxID=8319 RepID=A0AAV7WVW8_PLEWA|nr:hypothetical protein NDU88_004209 [Pleurodeles waltl]